MQGIKFVAGSRGKGRRLPTTPRNAERGRAGRGREVPAPSAPLLLPGVVVCCPFFCSVESGRDSVSRHAAGCGRRGRGGRLLLSTRGYGIFAASFRAPSFRGNFLLSVSVGRVVFGIALVHCGQWSPSGHFPSLGRPRQWLIGASLLDLRGAERVCLFQVFRAHFIAGVCRGQQR